MNKNKGIKIKETIVNHIMNNKKEYIIVSLIFIIGIFLGVLFINNIQEGAKEEITTYLKQFVEKMKNNQEINNIELLKTTIGQNIILTIIIWFFGTTVI